MSWSHPLEELKHSIKIYLQCAGGVTADLGMISLKLIDVLDDIRDSKNPSAELQHLATILIKSLIDAAQQRLMMLNVTEAIDLASALEAQKRKIPTNNLHHKQYYLTLLAQVQRDLERLTQSTYPTITNLDGDEL